MIDDHARSHAAFWNGTELILTPANDICPQARDAKEAGNAMLIGGQQQWIQNTACWPQLASST